MRAAALDVAVAVALVVGALAALLPFEWAYLTGPWAPSFGQVLPTTALAAAKVWTLWGAATWAGARMLLREAPDLGALDAWLGGAVLAWAGAVFAAHLLGPLGLLHGWLLTAAVWCALYWSLRRPVDGQWAAPTRGQVMALVAVVLVLPGMVLLQLGSPVPPHFDVMSPLAAAQRVVTFAAYRPFDNDPLGYYDASSQCPGTELLYAALALGSQTPLATVAATAASPPLAVLLIGGTYRLARTLRDDLAGGFAALLLCATALFRMLPTAHGRYASFALVAVGLAFLLDHARHPVRLGLGALALGTAVAAHAIIGAFAMAAAAVVAGATLLAGDRRDGWRLVALLAAASIIAMPTVAIGLQYPLPFPLLPLCQCLGMALIGWAVPAGPRPTAERVPRWVLLGLVALLVVAFVRQPATFSLLRDHWKAWRYPLLWMTGGVGLASALVVRQVAWQPTALVALLLVGLAGDWFGGAFQARVADPTLSVAIHDFYFKADFWYPFALVPAAACGLAWLAERVGVRPVAYVLGCALLVPWQYGATHPGARDPNYYQVGVAELWAEQVGTAKGGYWGSTPDRRWAQSPAQFGVIERLWDDIRAGRATLDTHVAVVTPGIWMFTDTPLVAVYTGLNADNYVGNWRLDRSTAGGRFYPLDALPEALARGVPYVAFLDVTAQGRRLDELMPDPDLVAYELLYEGGAMRLFRRRAGDA